MSPVVLTGLVAALALILTAVITPGVRAAALTGGLVRPVQADRWHKRPTPAIGGVAIFLGFGLAVGTGYLIDPGAARGLPTYSPHALLPLSTWEGLLLGSTLAFLVGLVDDFFHLGPLPKLVGQVVAASALLASGIGVWLTGVYVVDAALSLLWFVGLTNALNLLDNMDGLAAGIAAIAALYLSVIFVLDGSTGMAVLSVGFVAALLGFLAHNYPPARIFMGDSGSLFLGLFLAGLALAPAEGLSRSLVGVLAAPMLILGVPILDTTLVTVGRLLEGRPVSQGGKDHTSHRFVALGLPEKQTLWLLWAVAAAGGAIGVMLRSAERGTALLLGGVLVGAVALVGAYLLAVRLRTIDQGAAEGMSFYRFVVRSQERYPVLALFLDGIWIALAYYGAYLIRWEPAQLSAELPYFQRTVVIWVGVKLLAFVLVGAYSVPWRTFGLYDALRVGRGAVMGTFLATGTLFVIDHVGLSRGVIVIDLLLCALLTVGARFSFRLLDGTARRWREEGAAVVVLAGVDDAELALRQIPRLTEPKLRVVAVASPSSHTARGTLAGIPMFGGEAALRHAFQESGAHSVVVLEGPEDANDGRAALDRYRKEHGPVDAWVLRIGLHRLLPDAEAPGGGGA